MSDCQDSSALTGLLTECLHMCVLCVWKKEGGKEEGVQQELSFVNLSAPSLVGLTHGCMPAICTTYTHMYFPLLHVCAKMFASSRVIYMNVQKHFYNFSSRMLPWISPVMLLYSSFVCCLLSRGFRRVKGVQIIGHSRGRYKAWTYTTPTKNSSNLTDRPLWTCTPSSNGQ